MSVETGSGICSNPASLNKPLLTIPPKRQDRINLHEAAFFNTIKRPPSRINIADISPMDIARSGNLGYIGSWYKGRRIENGQLHVENEFQKKPGLLSRFIINRIVKPSSSKDEFYEQLKKDQEGMLQDSKKI